MALAMGTTGIAANLLDLGRTFHSRMKAPLTPTEDSFLNIRAQSTLAELIKAAKILMIDESTMLHKFQLEAMDRTLRDIMEDERPFGGKIVVLAGDFRQCLPVVPGDSRDATVNCFINRYFLWQHFEELKLTVNMRVRASGEQELIEFDEWLIRIGDGTENFKNDDWIDLPHPVCTIIGSGTDEKTDREGESMREFCEKIFPRIKENVTNSKWLEGRAILAPKNKQVDTPNAQLVEKISGTSTVLHSSDVLDNKKDTFRYNTEYLNTLHPTGLP